MTPREILRTMTTADREAVLGAIANQRLADYGMPNVYRVRAGGRRGRWQCEWDDWTELGSWRSRFLGRAVRQAQRARRAAIADALSELP